ncbi:Uncharacterised protein [Citrobacter koseri]|nr:Uncharacterised protein [Citrobacter koseri]
MARVIRPTNDAGYIAANRINSGLAKRGTSIYGTVNLCHYRKHKILIFATSLFSLTPCSYEQGVFAYVIHKGKPHEISQPFWSR